MPIDIVMTTWMPDEARLASALTASHNWYAHLYGDDGLRLIVADDGSPAARLAQLEADAVTRAEAQGVGASLNRGLALAGDLILHAVDDWIVETPFNLAPWARLLEDGVADMVRFFAHPNLRGKTENTAAGFVVRLEPGHGFEFATRPFLAHRRFFEAVGPFAERVSACEAERDYNVRWRAQGQANILLALNVPLWTPLESHASLSDIDPATRHD